MQVHHFFLLCSLVLAAPVGTALGVHMLAAWSGLGGPVDWAREVPLHGHLQVFGFVGLFTMGMALLMWPKVLNVPLQGTGLAHLSWLGMLAGLGMVALNLPHLAAGLQMLSALTFLATLVLTRRAALRSSRPARGPLSGGQSLLLACAHGWLVAAPLLAFQRPALGLDMGLWGFASLYVAGLGLRLHPAMLGVKGTRSSLVVPCAILWNLGLLLRCLGVAGWGEVALVAAVALLLAALRPFRRPSMPAAGLPWLRPYVRLAYGWLVVAVLLQAACPWRPWLESAARHALAGGFLLTMIVGMGLRMLLAFEARRLAWTSGPWAVLVGLAMGTLCRVTGQTLGDLGLTALGGGAQALAIAAFIALLLSAKPIPLPALPGQALAV